jgi:hypothetical protein
MHRKTIYITPQHRVTDSGANVAGVGYLAQPRQEDTDEAKPVAADYRTMALRFALRGRPTAAPPSCQRTNPQLAEKV